VWFANAIRGEKVIMQITNSYNTNLNATARGIQAPAESTANTTSTTRATQPNNEVTSELPVIQPTNIDETVTIRQEINQLLQQFNEWMRVATESKRMEFLYNILLKESHETSDLFGKIMDIARRIMNGEEVSLEEMRFLSDQNPQLLYVVILLKDDITDVDERNRRRERDRRKTDRRSGPRRRDYRARSQHISEINVMESMKYVVPRNTDKRIHSLIAQRSIRKSYSRTDKNLKLSISIDEVITNPLEIAN